MIFTKTKQNNVKRINKTLLLHMLEYISADPQISLSHGSIITRYHLQTASLLISNNTT